MYFSASDHARVSISMVGSRGGWALRDLSLPHSSAELRWQRYGRRRARKQSWDFRLLVHCARKHSSPGSSEAPFHQLTTGSQALEHADVHATHTTT